VETRVWDRMEKGARVRTMEQQHQATEARAQVRQRLHHQATPSGPHPLPGPDHWHQPRPTATGGSAAAAGQTPAHPPPSPALPVVRGGPLPHTKAKPSPQHGAALSLHERGSLRSHCSVWRVQRAGRSQDPKKTAPRPHDYQDCPPTLPTARDMI
jgi:hypothetical protein